MSGVIALARMGPRAPSDEELLGAAVRMQTALRHRGRAHAPITARGAVLGPVGGPSACHGPWIAVGHVRLDRPADVAAALRLDPRTSDLQLLLEGFVRWGDDVVLRADGDFAAAIWDTRAGELTLLRDPLGQRPIFVTRNGDVVLAASEVGALAASGLAPPLAFDRREAARYLVEEYAEERRTLFADVEAAQPGGVTRWRPGVATRQRVWIPDPFAITSPDPASCAEQLRSALADAVRARLPSRDDVSVLVSGGLDSSSVAVLAARMAASPPTLLHLTFPGTPSDERSHFEAVAGAVGGRSVVVDPREHARATAPFTSPGGAAAPYEPTLAMLAPLLDAAGVPRGAIVLTGMGGDDLMHVTGWEGVDALRHGALRTALRYATDDARPVRALGRMAVRALTPGPLIDVARRLGRRAEHLWPPWLEDDVRRELHAWHLERMERRRSVVAPTEVQRRIALLLTGESDLFVFLSRLDGFAAAVGVELRHPFYDRRVVELLLAIPSEQRASRTEVKSVLRRALRDVLPETVRTRQDAADFTPFVRHLVTGPHRPAYEETFAASELERQGVVRPGALRHLLGRSQLTPVVQAMGLEVAIRARMNASG